MSEIHLHVISLGASRWSVKKTGARRALRLFTGVEARSDAVSWAFDRAQEKSLGLTIHKENGTVEVRYENP